MSDLDHTTRVAFTPAVRAMQERMGTRAQMEVMARRRGFRTEITPDLADFIAARDSFFLATATAEGQPYVQHRGGPAGFLEVTGPRTLRFPDYPGNRQFLTLGNLSENARVHLFLIDYGTRTRIKIWGRGRLAEEAGARWIEVEVTAWDPNCDRHVPELWTRAEVEAATAGLRARIAALEAELGG